MLVLKIIKIYLAKQNYQVVYIFFNNFSAFLFFIYPTCFSVLLENLFNSYNSSVSFAAYPQT